MGLGRTTQVLAQMGLLTPKPPVITVAGTNGKGSTVAYLQSICTSAGLRCGTTTSPHIFSVNERICINGQPIADNNLVECLNAVEVGRGDVSLTYFEFLIVAALYWFEQQNVDVVVLEVGLGGRLDATNCIDADVAIVTSIGIDHVAWLGSDPLKIAEEKAAISRTHKPLILADSAIPRTADALALDRGATIVRVEEDYSFDALGTALSVQYRSQNIDIPKRGISSVPPSNAAAAVIAAHYLPFELGVSTDHIQHGISQATLTGRGECRRVQWAGRVLSVEFDVAHNPASARVLADKLDQLAIKPVALCAMLADKDCRGVYANLAQCIADWHVAGLAGCRGQSAEALMKAMGNPSATLHQYVETALPLVLDQMVADNRTNLVVFGSFETVALALTWFAQHDDSPT